MARHTLENQSAASIPTPSTGRTTMFVDSADKHLKIKDDTGTVTDTSVPGSAITSLTSEVTATGPGAAAATVSNAAVIAKVLTGYTAGSGNVTATDSILQAFQKLGGRLGWGWYGDGHDGAAVYSSDTTLVRDMYHTDFTVNAGVNLFTNGFRIHFTGTATVNGTIDRSGNAGVGTTIGAALAAQVLGGSGAGGTAGGTTAGGAGGATTSTVGGLGGSGGAGSGNAGGAAGTVTNPTAAVGGTDVLFIVGRGSLGRDVAGTLLTGGSGGGGGGGSGVALSGAGGGSGGGIIVLSGKTLTGTGTIRANGGAGGNGALVGGGGGGGGGGGAIVLITDNDTTTTSLTIQVNGGAGGSGNGGTNGNAGSAGRIYRIRS